MCDRSLYGYVIQYTTSLHCFSQVRKRANTALMSLSPLELTNITFHLQHMLMSLLRFHQIVSRYLARQEWSLLLEPAGAHPLEGHDNPTVKGGHCLCGGRSCATCSGHMIDLNWSEVSTL